MLSVVLRYAVPLALLAGVLVAFRRAPGYRPLAGAPRGAVIFVAALPLVVSGSVHLLRPGMMVPLLPGWAPGRVVLIWLTGLPEIAGAVGLCVPRTRRLASVWLAVFLIAIFPANIYVAGRTVAGLPMPGVPLRCAMQAAYMLLVLIAGHGLPTWKSAPSARPGSMTKD